MATQVQTRRGTTAQHGSFTGAAGELTVDTDKKTVVVHDGSTAGGAPLLRENGSQNAVTTGTSTAASFIPTGSTVPTNGIYLPSASTVGVATNGTGRLFVDSSGQVGVGTSSPSWLLDLLGSAPRIRVKASSTGATFHHLENNSGNFFLGIDNSTGGSLSAGNYARLLWSQGAYPLVFGTNDTQRMVITSAGLVGIGTASPGALLHAAGKIRFGSNTTYYGEIDHDAASTGSNIYDHSDSGGHIFKNGGQEALRIDSSKRLLVGTSSSNADYNSDLQIAGASTSFLVSRYSANAAGPYAYFYKSRSATVGTGTIVQNGDELGSIYFGGSDGVTSRQAAAIQALIDGTPGSGDYPGRLVFSTTADGASSPTERVRIDSSGKCQHASVTNTTLWLFNSQAAGTTYYLMEGFYSGSINTGTRSVAIYTNGNIINTNNSYGAISDIKLKENIVDANSQWDDVKALRVRKYNLKEGQTHTQIGLIAQEAELVSPGLVSESFDRDAEGNDLGTVTKSVNYSVLYMKAVKALQEAMERIETLEAKVAALEAQ